MKLRRIKSAEAILIWPRPRLSEILEAVKKEKETSSIEMPPKMPQEKTSLRFRNISEDTLIELIRKKNFNKLNLLIKDGIPPNGFSNKYRTSAFLEAIRLNQPEAILALMKCGRNPLEKKNNHQTPLEFAVIKEKKESLKAILYYMNTPAKMSQECWSKAINNENLRKIFLTYESGISGVSEHLISYGRLDLLASLLQMTQVLPVMTRENATNHLLMDPEFLDYYLIGESAPLILEEAIKRGMKKLFIYLFKRLRILKYRTGISKRVLRACLYSPEPYFLITFLNKEGLDKNDVIETLLFWAEKAEKRGDLKSALIIREYIKTNIV